MKQITREWIDKAEGDFTSAGRELRARKSPNYDAACFHAQQCAEKYLKAYLVPKNVDFPYTHNILRLIELCPPETPWRAEVDQSASLSPYALSARYPGEDEPVSEEQAVEAVHVAGHAREVVRCGLMSTAFESGIAPEAKNLWPIREEEWCDSRDADH